MGDMQQLQRQQQQLIQQQQQQQQQQKSNLQQNQQQYSTQQTMDQAAIEQTISANKYLQNQKDADAADPHPNREELLERQLTVGLGKKDGIQAAHDQAGN